jgi:hypothetical protein
MGGQFVGKKNKGEKIRVRRTFNEREGIWRDRVWTVTFIILLPIVGPLWAVMYLGEKCEGALHWLSDKHNDVVDVITPHEREDKYDNTDNHL